MRGLSSKKGDLNLLVPSILALVLAAIILIFGLLMMDEIKSETVDRTMTITNESFTTVTNATNESFASSSTTDCGFSSLAVTSVVNKSNDWAIPATNYTVYDNGYLISTDALCTGVNGGVSPALSACSWDWNVTYTYTYGSEACDASNKTIAGIGSFADYWDLIVLAIVITIIISLLLVVFATSRTR